MSVEWLVLKLKGVLYRLAQAAVRRGLPPAWLGFRCVLKETPSDYFSRYTEPEAEEAGTYETIHPVSVASNPLPCNVDEQGALPADRGWWGFSFRDVPSRTSHPTCIVRIPDGCVVPYIDPEKNQFWSAVLNRDARALELREMSFRSFHKEVLRTQDPVRRARVTWILERVYRNHSHWLTAHLPKLLLLKGKNELADVLLPPRQLRTSVMDDSLRMLGIDPESLSTFDPTRPLDVDELAVLETDRFRPELLRPVRDALCTFNGTPSHRKIYISRAQAPRRRLVNEDDIWGLLEGAGFERVFMEDLSFKAQVKLMQETSIVVAPHGAGLTNMMFCAPGTHIVEIADLSFPNPNFYALASAMEHNYWLVSAEGVGDEHPLERDMGVPPSAVRRVLLRLPL